MATQTPDKSGFPLAVRGTGWDGIFGSLPHDIREPAWIVSQGGPVDRLCEMNIQLCGFAGFQLRCLG